MNTVSVTDLRQDATNILNSVVASQEPTYVIQNSQARAVILDAGYFDNLQEVLEDFMDGLDVDSSLKESGAVSLDKYMVKRWGKNYARQIRKKLRPRKRSL